MLTALRHFVESRPVTSACRVATGRSAILHMARRWNPEVVFMPCYVPEGVLQPFIEARAQIVFYKLDHKLNPNHADLERLMDKNKGKRPVVVLIHYFGMGAVYGGVEQLAEKHGGIVFSDCAHCLPDGRWRGGDIKLYSLNKFLPVPDGALLISRRSDLDVSLDESALSPLPAAAINSYVSHLSENQRIALAKPDDPQMAAYLDLSVRNYEDYYRIISTDMTLHSQSALSRAVEARCDFAQMKDLCFAKSRTLCDSAPMNMLLDEDQRCQFAFPVRCNGRLDEIEDALCRAGIMPATCVDKWDHIPSSGFTVEREFIHDHLLLPIGEAVEYKDALTMGAVLMEFAR